MDEKLFFNPSPEVIEMMMGIWERRTGTCPTEDEAREAVQNLTGFFKLLIELDQKSRDSQTGK